MILLVAFAFADAPIFDVETMDVRAGNGSGVSHACGVTGVELSRTLHGDYSASFAQKAADASEGGQLSALAFWDIHVLAGGSEIPGGAAATCFALAARPFAALFHTDHATTFTSLWVRHDELLATGLASLATRAASRRNRALLVYAGAARLLPAAIAAGGHAPFATREVVIAGTDVERAEFVRTLFPAADSDAGSFLILY